jgi:hypothetical protein
LGRADLRSRRAGLFSDAARWARYIHGVNAAAGRGVGNAAWVRMRAEDLPAGLGRFRAVTFAASFHWMDRPQVASAVTTMLDPGGGGAGRRAWLPGRGTLTGENSGAPNGIRTRVAALKGRCPRPLDDGGVGGQLPMAV